MKTYVQLARIVTAGSRRDELRACRGSCRSRTSRVRRRQRSMARRPMVAALRWARTGARPPGRRRWGHRKIKIHQPALVTSLGAGGAAAVAGELIALQLYQAYSLRACVASGPRSAASRLTPPVSKLRSSAT
jgi:hypothetical protein